MQYLVHHGILGQKWGVRRFQNQDGTLTPEGRERRGLTDKQKKILRSGVVIAGTLIAAYAGYKVVRDPKVRSFVTKFINKKNVNVEDIIQNSGPDIVRKTSFNMHRPPTIDR